MGVVGVGGVGEQQQQRRAMGDSSHYEEIALIGNGNYKQNGVDIKFRNSTQFLFDFISK
jgi:hypothetical protein